MNKPSKISSRERPIIIGLYLFAIGVVLFWISFFWGGAVHTSDNDCYVVFERNFVAADIFTAIAALLCAEKLRRGKKSALIWGGVSAGGILFLLLMDLSWNLLQGAYSNFSFAMLTENMINIFCAIFGPYLIYFLLHKQGQNCYA